MLLHIISKSPTQHSALKDALPFITNTDTVIFIDDGVYACTSQLDLIQSLNEIDCRVTALIEDIDTRGLTSINDKIDIISMSDFVGLSFSCSKTLSWY